MKAADIALARLEATKARTESLATPTDAHSALGRHLLTALDEVERLKEEVVLLRYCEFREKSRADRNFQAFSEKEKELERTQAELAACYARNKKIRAQLGDLYLKLEEQKRNACDLFDEARRAQTVEFKLRERAELEATQALRMWRIDDDNDGRTWVIARDEANALLEFSRMDESFAEWPWSDLEVFEVEPGFAVTMELEECEGGPQTRTAAEWCRERGAGVLCSTWWEL